MPVWLFWALGGAAILYANKKGLFSKSAATIQSNTGALTKSTGTSTDPYGYTGSTGWDVARSAIDAIGKVGSGPLGESLGKSIGDALTGSAKQYEEGYSGTSGRVYTVEDNGITDIVYGGVYGAVGRGGDGYQK